MDITERVDQRQTAGLTQREVTVLRVGDEGVPVRRVRAVGWSASEIGDVGGITKRFVIIPQHLRVIGISGPAPENAENSLPLTDRSGGVQLEQANQHQPIKRQANDCAVSLDTQMPTEPLTRWAQHKIILPERVASQARIEQIRIYSERSAMRQSRLTVWHKASVEA